MKEGEIKIFTNVSRTQLSIAKYYGGINISGKEYQYDYANDILFPKGKFRQYKKELIDIEWAKTPSLKPITK